MVWFIVALVLDRVMLKLTVKSYTSPFTVGYGSISNVIAGTALAPVSHRVLVPWLIAAAERVWPTLQKHRLPALYEPIRIVGIGLALNAVAMALGERAAWMVAALLPATFLYDFWDWPYEFLAQALALSGNMQWAILGAGLQGFARPETTPLVALTYLLVTGDVVGTGLIGLASLVALLTVRVIVGKKPLVRSLNTWDVNQIDLRRLFHNRPFYLSEVVMTLGLMALTLASILTGKAGPAWPVPVIIMAAQLFWQARLSETRSMSVCLLWAVRLL